MRWFVFSWQIFLKSLDCFVSKALICEFSVQWEFYMVNESISYLVEQLPKLFILVDSEDVIAGEDAGASDTEDVVNVQHQVGDVTQGEQTKNNLFSWSGGSETWAID